MIEQFWVEYSGIGVTKDELVNVGGFLCCHAEERASDQSEVTVMSGTEAFFQGQEWWQRQFHDRALRSWFPFGLTETLALACKNEAVNRLGSDHLRFQH